jgi:GntR family transcriptional regulator
MFSFSTELKSGSPVYEQVVYAVKKAIVSGHMKPGDSFPSVRKLSQELRINPNTAHKVVAALVAERLLEVKPGIGTVVAEAPGADRAARRALLGATVEKLVVEAKQMSLTVDDVTEAIRSHWKLLR